MQSERLTRVLILLLMWSSAVLVQAQVNCNTNIPLCEDLLDIQPLEIVYNRMNEPITVRCTVTNCDTVKSHIACTDATGILTNDLLDPVRIDNVLSMQVRVETFLAYRGTYVQCQLVHGCCPAGSCVCVSKRTHIIPNHDVASDVTSNTTRFLTKMTSTPTESPVVSTTSPLPPNISLIISTTVLAMTVVTLLLVIIVLILCQRNDGFRKIKMCCSGTDGTDGMEKGIQAGLQNEVTGEPPPLSFSSLAIQQDLVPTSSVQKLVAGNSIHLPAHQPHPQTLAPTQLAKEEIVNLRASPMPARREPNSSTTAYYQVVEEPKFPRRKINSGEGENDALRL